jgi:hypothetical protein
MPIIDDGPTDGAPGSVLRTAWVELSANEASDLLESLKVWAEDVAEGEADPGWHAHITDEAGRELTLSVKLPGQPSARLAD